jgi:drug/metabolite transporter (DMT)-like permease
METKKNLKLGVFYALFAIVLFSIMNATIKGIKGDYHPSQIAFMRFFVSLIPCFGFYYFEKNRPSLFISTKLTLKHFARGLICAFSITALCAALRNLPLGDATAINFSAILFITALSVPILKQKVDLSRWISILVGFLAVLIIAKPAGEIFSIGAAYAIFYAATDAFVIIVGPLICRQHSAGAATFLLCLFAAIVSGIMSSFYWETPSLNDWMFFLAVGIFGGSGSVFQTLSYNLAPASVVAPMAYSGMIWGLLLGFLFWQEIPGLSSIVGYLLIIASGCYIIYKESTHKVL